MMAASWCPLEMAQGPAHVPSPAREALTESGPQESGQVRRKEGNTAAELCSLWPPARWWSHVLSGLQS